MALPDLSPVGVSEPAQIWRRWRFDFTPAVLASYPTPNYVNPAERGPEIYIFNSIFFLIMVTCVTLRLYTRICVRKYFGLDDVFISFALIGAIGVNACVMLAFHKYYWSRHVYDIPLDSISPSGQILFATKIIWYFTSNSIRASVMCLYYRLIDHTGMAKYRWILHVNSVFILGLFITQESTTIFGCWPTSRIWSFPHVVLGKCFIDRGVAMFTGAVLNTFSELVVAALPLPVIFSLNISRRQRQAVTALLCGGFVVVIIGSVRTYYVWMTIVTFDPSWWAEPHWVCSEIEMDVAIICACAPAMMPMLSRVFTRGLSAANKVNETYETTVSNFRARKTRSLFNQLKEQGSMTGLSTSTARSEATTGRQPSTKETIDLEGINNKDGYGYSVTITTGHGTKVKRRWDIRNKKWHYYPEEPISDIEEEEEANHAPNSRNRSVFSRSSGIRKQSTSSLHFRDVMKMQAGVRAEKSFEVRESFQSERIERGFDYRNPYHSGMPGKHEEDIEIALQVPEVEVSDWSLFDGEINRRMASRILPEEEVRHYHQTSMGDLIPSSPAVPAPVQPRWSRTSYDAQHYPPVQRRSTIDSVRPVSGSNRFPTAHKLSRSYDNIRMGVLPSPSTEAFSERIYPPYPPKKGVLKTPAPPPLPPAARFPRRSSSPAVKPLNSSQLWATSPHLKPQRGDPLSSQRNSQETTSFGTNTTTTTTTGSSDAMVMGPGQWQKSSMHSSMHAENGSRQSAKGTRLEPPRQDRDDESSDEEFSLPLQRPSPRNSGFGQ